MRISWINIVNAEGTYFHLNKRTHTHTYIHTEIIWVQNQSFPETTSTGYILFAKSNSRLRNGVSLSEDLIHIHICLTLLEGNLDTHMIWTSPAIWAKYFRKNASRNLLIFFFDIIGEKSNTCRQTVIPCLFEWVLESRSKITLRVPKSAQTRRSKNKSQLVIWYK